MIITTTDSRIAKLLHPVLIYHGGLNKPMRPENHGFPPGTVITNNKDLFKSANKGKPLSKAYSFSTRDYRILYAIEP